MAARAYFFEIATKLYHGQRTHTIAYYLNFAQYLRHLRLRLKSQAEICKSSQDDYHPTGSSRIHAAFILSLWIHPQASFFQVIEKAKTACENAGNGIDNHFANVRKMVEIGSQVTRQIDDTLLTR